MPPSPALRLMPSIAAIGLGLALGPPGFAAAEPSPLPAAPALSAPELARGRQLQLRYVPDAAGTGRGHSFTDAAHGSPTAPPNALERAKLDLARAAIEASRAAGTLQLLPRIEEPRQALESNAPERKLARMRSRPPAILRPDAAAGLAPGQGPIQRTGPPGLTPLEVAKLNGQPLPALPPAIRPPVNEAGAMGDGSPKHPGSPAEKEDRRD